jgi:uncharacterized membrane protein
MPAKSKARFVRRSLYATLAGITFACLWGTVLTDVVYWQTAAMQWSNFSAWLLTVGLFVAVPAVILGLIDLLDRRVRAISAAWIHGLAAGLALPLSIVNAFVHTQDAYSSVVPDGLTLSAIVAVIILISAVSGWSLLYRHGARMCAEERS